MFTLKRKPKTSKMKAKKELKK